MRWFSVFIQINPKDSGEQDKPTEASTIVIVQDSLSRSIVKD